MWRGRDLLHFFPVDPVRDTDAVDLDIVVAGSDCLRDGLTLVTGRVTVGNDDGDVLHTRPVAIFRFELDVVHDADAAGDVRVAAQVPDRSDGRLQRVLVRVLVHVEHALCVRREFDGADADVARIDIELIDDANHELQQQMPVVVGAVLRVVVPDAARTVDHECDVCLVVLAFGCKRSEDEVSVRTAHRKEVRTVLCETKQNLVCYGI